MNKLFEFIEIIVIETILVFPYFSVLIGVLTMKLILALKNKNRN